MKKMSTILAVLIAAVMVMGVTASAEAGVKMNGMKGWAVSARAFESWTYKQGMAAEYLDNMICIGCVSDTAFDEDSQEGGYHFCHAVSIAKKRMK